MIGLGTSVLLAGACSGADESTSTREGSTAPTTVSPAQAGLTAPAPDTTVRVPIESGGCSSRSEVTAGEGSAATADVDGDGDPDTLRVFETEASEWFLQVMFGAGGSAGVVLEGEGVRVAGAEALPGGDIDGDGVDEVFVRAGGGDGTNQVALFAVRNCVVEPILYEGSPALFTVGAVTGAIFGIQCGPASGRGGEALFVAEGRQDGGGNFTVTTSEYVLEAGVLSRVGSPVERSVSEGDEGYVAASTLACGNGLIIGS